MEAHRYGSDNFEGVEKVFEEIGRVAQVVVDLKAEPTLLEILSTGGGERVMGLCQSVRDELARIDLASLSERDRVVIGNLVSFGRQNPECIRDFAIARDRRNERDIVDGDLDCYLYYAADHSKIESGIIYPGTLIDAIPQ